MIYTILLGAQFIEQFLRLFQIERVETLSEPAINGIDRRRLRFLISAGEARRIAPNIAKLPGLLGKTVP